MGDTEGDFITRFHNLEGNLVSERKKNFFKLLQDRSVLPDEERLEIALKDLRPNTYLESLLRIDMLIYFRKTSQLLETLKEGNEVYISKIIKQPWFFEEAFREISADEFVNEFLPCTSFSVRMKILKRLSLTLNETQLDDLYECLLKRYGLYIAANILHRCSSKKILEVLSNNEIHLRPNQVTILFDRDLNLFKNYLRHYQSITQSPYKEKYVFKYIALRNPQFLLELKKDDKLNIQPLGRRLSKKVINLVKDDITKDVAPYASLLKHNVIVRTLQGDFKNVYFDLFPRKLDEVDISNLCNKLLRFYPKKRQWDLFAQTFARVFHNQTVMDNLNYLSAPILSMCASNEVKQRWAEVQYNKKGDNSFLKYYEPAKLIPLIKAKINVCSKGNERLSLLKIMLNSCKEHGDLAALEEVLEYACLRLRNVEHYIIKLFVHHIRSCFSLEDLSENHWRYINELIDIARMKSEHEFYYQYLAFTKKYLEFLFKNGKHFRRDISWFIKATVQAREKFWTQVNNGVIEKEILTQILNIIPYKVHEESSDYKWVYQRLILDVINFSRLDCNAEYCIRLLDFPHLVKFIQSILEKTDHLVDAECKIITNIIRYNRQFPQNAVMIEKARLQQVILTVSMDSNKFKFKDLLEFMLPKKNRSELENVVLKLYFDKIIEKHVSHSINFWFLRNEPETLIPYITKLATINGLCVYKYRRRRVHYNHWSYLKEIKLCSHLNIDLVFIDLLQKQLRDPNCESKVDIMKYLSMLLSTDDFIKVVAEYFLPNKIKLDLQDEEMKKFYKLQCDVAKILKDVSEPDKMLPTVMKFCIGDYLQSALSSLYSVCCRSPESQLYLYVDILSERAVSVRKHALFISCAVLDYNYAVNQLKTAEQNNVSSQKHVFLATQKYFLRNQTEDLLDLLISNMSTIDKNDTETFNSLSSIKVPKRFQVLYIEKCWRFFESVRLAVMVDDYLRSLLYKISESTDVIVSLPSGFCKDVISNYFDRRIEDLSNVELYVCKVLRYKKLEQKENFNFVFSVILNFKANNKSERISKFFKEFYSLASSNNCHSDFVSLFCMHWEQCFTPVEMFDEYVLLKLLMMKYNSTLIDNFAENVVIFMNQLMLEYGLYVCNRFKPLLKTALTSDFVDKKDRYLFFYHFLKCNTAAPNCILVIDIMDKVYEDHAKDSAEDKKIFEIYCDVLQMLRKIKIPIVEVYYKSYLREI